MHTDSDDNEADDSDVCRGSRCARAVASARVTGAELGRRNGQRLLSPPEFLANSATAQHQTLRFGWQSSLRCGFVLLALAAELFLNGA